MYYFERKYFRKAGGIVCRIAEASSPPHRPNRLRRGHRPVAQTMTARCARSKESLRNGLKRRGTAYRSQK
jgi:hypothetical protein